MVRYGICKEHTILARQLAPNENGLPIEIYAFKKDIELKKYEEIQQNTEL